ncbi:MAG TPA: right-handed parallel beta-helix repeat-containing protein [Polyangiales bacterium]|nr:right-handed parallel beta-helix repeat-containing protein [Polyangiales bacterium]
MTGRAERLRWIAAIAFMMQAGIAHAAEFYVDPAAGSSSGDGSREKPWQTWEAVLQAGLVGTTIHAGDTVWLRSGKHGASAVKGGTYAPAITLAAEAGQTPQLSAATFAQTKGWVVRALAISASFGTKTGGNLLSIDKSSADITVRECKLFSVEDASGWTADQWINTASSGISVSGDHVVISHNQLTNVRFGISVDGPNALIEYNSVVNFSADGLRGLGDNGVFQYNLVKNVYVSQEDGDDNHDDGFQSWSTGPNGPGSGVVKGVVLRGNTIINREDPAQKLSNSLQGIGCFDGFFDDWIVENNVVATDHWHGISLYGMRGGRIVNNTVVDVNAVDPGPPWIMVNDHKDGTKSNHVLIRNNLATDYSIAGDDLTQDHNTELKDLAMYFVDPAKLDLHLKAGAAAIDQGSADQAPALDAERISRPQGGAIDLGAYESHDPSVKPSDGEGGQDLVPPPAAGQGAPRPPSGGAGAAGVSAGTGGQPKAGSAGEATSGRGGSRAAIDAGGEEADGGSASDKSSDCGCRLSHRQTSLPLAWLLLAAFAVTRLRRTKRR